MMFLMMYCVTVFKKLVCFFFCIFSTSCSAAAFCANFGMYLVRLLMEPMKLFSCLNVLGDSLSIASVFLLMVLCPRCLWCTLTSHLSTRKLTFVQ